MAEANRTAEAVSQQAALEKLFGGRGWLSGTPASFREMVLKLGRQISVPRGQRIFAYGDQPGGTYGVISGGVGMEACSDHHQIRLGHVVRAGDWMGHGSVLGHATRSLGCWAIEDSVLLYVPLQAFSAVIRADAEAARLVGELANQNANLLIRICCDLLTPDAARRTAAVLLRVTGALEGVRPSHADGYALTQSELGEMANVSRHHVNRLLGQFADRGWIAKSYNRLRLLDVQALSDFAYGED